MEIVNITPCGHARNFMLFSMNLYRLPKVILHVIRFILKLKNIAILDANACSIKIVKIHQILIYLYCIHQKEWLTDLSEFLHIISSKE